MTRLNPYLSFNGNCEEAFGFYQSVFQSKITHISRFADIPSMEGKENSMSDIDANKIMHISLPISEESTLMGSDSSDAFGQVRVMGNNFSISIDTDSKEEADRLYNALSEDGKSSMPMVKSFWGSYFGMLSDKFGIQWMISYDEQKKPSKSEE